MNNEHHFSEQKPSHGSLYFLGLSKLGTELTQLEVALHVVLEEGLLVGSIALGVGAEALVLKQARVGGEHQQVGVLLLLDIHKVAVVELEPLGGPGLATRGTRAVLSIFGLLLAEPRALGAGAADGVGARQGDDVLVGETVAFDKDVAQVGSGVGSLREEKKEKRGSELKVKI